MRRGFVRQFGDASKCATNSAPTTACTPKQHLADRMPREEMHDTASGHVKVRSAVLLLQNAVQHTGSEGQIRPYAHNFQTTQPQHLQGGAVQLREVNRPVGLRKLRAAELGLEEGALLCQDEPAVRMCETSSPSSSFICRNCHSP